MTAALSIPAASRRTQIFEFLVVGGITPFLYPLAWAFRRVLGFDAAELAVSWFFFYLAHFVNDPHFGVTYLLFYRDVKRRAVGDVWGWAQRARYWFAGFIAPLLMAAWCTMTLFHHAAPGIGMLIQLMFLLVGWHYGKQGFGVLAVLSQRRGVVLEPIERYAYLAHAYAAWAYAWSSPPDPGTELEERGVVYTSFPHGVLLERITLIVLAATVVLVAFVIGRRLARGRPLPPLGALFGYFCALWPWTVYSRLDPLVLYVIPALHSIQYLYFVGLLQKAGAEGPSRPFALGSVGRRLGLLAVASIGLAWVLFHGMPEVLDAIFFPHRSRMAPEELDALGPAPIVAAVFVCINVHHYLMDHVIWRRENPEMAKLRYRAPAAPVEVALAQVPAE